MDYSKFIRKRTLNLGVKFHDAKLLGSWFSFQIANQGLIQGLDYLKAVGDAIVAVHSGSRVRTPWVRLKHRYPAQVWYLRKYPLDVQLRIAKFARSITFEEIIPRQVDKVVTGATAPYSGSEDGIAALSDLVKIGLRSTSLLRVGQNDQPRNPKHIARVFQRTLTSQTKGHTIIRTEPPVLESLEVVMQNVALYQLPYWTESFYPLSRNYLKAYQDTYPKASEGTTVGYIHASQEGGGKLRMYAAPHSIVQCLLLPIHDWIVKRRQVLYTDCTNNQLSGALWAKEILAKGGTVWSVDLRTATCRVPLEPQLFMLELLGLEPVYINALKWACTGTWSVGSELLESSFPETMSWSVGQPLGIAPSMSMFSTFHNLLLRGLCKRNCIPYDSYRVLGDDVVISDERLYNAYIEVLDASDVPISWNKCHISDRYAEFAGASITPNLLLRPGQWTRAVMNNHLSLAVELRRPLIGEVSAKLLKAEKLYLFMLGLYDPPVSKWSKYLKWSSSLEVVKYDNFIRGKLYEGGARALFSRLFKKPVQLPNGKYVFPLHQAYPDIFLNWLRPFLDMSKSYDEDESGPIPALKDEVINLYPWMKWCYIHAYRVSTFFENDQKAGVEQLLMNIADRISHEAFPGSPLELYSTLRERALNLIYGGQAKNKYAKADQTLTNRLLKVMQNL